MLRIAAECCWLLLSASESASESAAECATERVCVPALTVSGGAAGLNPNKLPTRPPVRRRLQMRPSRLFALARSVTVAKSEGRAISRRCVAAQAVRCEQSAATHDRLPPFVRRRQIISEQNVPNTAPRAINSQSARIQFSHSGRSPSADRGSLSRATTSLWPYCRASSRAVSPSLSRSVGSAPCSRRRLTIARRPLIAAPCRADRPWF